MRALSASIFVVLFKLAVFAQFSISAPEPIHTAMPAHFPCDAVCATVQESNGLLRTYSSSFDRTYCYRGTAEKPWGTFTKYMNVDYYDTLSTYAQEHTAEYVLDFGTPRYHSITNAGDSVGFYLKNIYRVNDQELIGFIHIEYYHQGRPPEHQEKDVYPAYYSIGLCRSVTNGTHWTFCGDIIHTFRNYTGEYSYNIGGAAYIVVGEYFYLYFNEFATAGVTIPAVARCSVQSVIDSARAGHTTAWSKWTGDTTWSARACGSKDMPVGLGAAVIADSILTGVIDLHSDAIYCSTTGTYLLVAPKSDTLFLLQSTDGLSWTMVQPVAIKNSGTHGSIPQFPFFVGRSAGRASDHSIAATPLYLYFINRLPAQFNGCSSSENLPRCFGEFRKDGRDFPLWRVTIR